MQEQAVGRADQGAARGVYRSTRWALRVGLFVQAAMAVTQPILAGLYLSGNLDAIDIHSTIGGSLAAVTFVVLLLALLHWLIGRGPAWPSLALAVLVVAVVTQATAGYSRTLGLHIPLGVTVVGSSVVLFGWSVFGKERIRPRRVPRAAPPVVGGAS